MENALSLVLHTWTPQGSLPSFFPPLPFPSLPSFLDLLRTSYMSATVLDARDRAMNKTDKIRALIGGIWRVGQWEE